MQIPDEGHGMPIKQCLSLAFILGFLILPQGAAQQPADKAPLPKALPASTIVLRGTIVTPDEVIPDGLVTISGSMIIAVTPFAGAQPGLKFVETDSYILPGLVDVHNHIAWNFLPRWQPKQKFASRYEWQKPPAPGAALDDFEHALLTPRNKVLDDQDLACGADLYGEVKAIVGGATSTIGGRGLDDDPCIAGLARNLDDAPDFGRVLVPKLMYKVFPFDATKGGIDPKTVAAELSAGTRFLLHVAEGTDSQSAGEFQIMGRYGLLRHGVSVIHGIALGKHEFELMANKQVGLIWSPRSDIELYGATTDVRSAKAAGVKVALAPDWSPTGSDGLLQELNYAALWNTRRRVFSDRDLVRMATAIPAQLAGLDQRIGSVAQGYYADLLLVRKPSVAPVEADFVYHALVHASPADVRLVMIGGVAVYGDSDLMDQTSLNHSFETITVCGKQKALDTSTGAPGPLRSFQQISQAFDNELKTFRKHLAPLATCEGRNLR